MNRNEKPIGIFDSGMGGITVVKLITELLPNENIIYLGDTANVPYGSKTPDEIEKLARHNSDFLTSFDVKEIVVACNTVDSTARSKIESSYSVPFVGIVKPTSKQAALSTANNRIGLIATSATVNNGAYERAVKSFNENAQVYSVACPKLVPLAESGRFSIDDKEAYEIVENYLNPLKEKDIDTLILGCTHYPLFSKMISEIMPNVKQISSSHAAANALKEELTKNNLENNSDGKPSLKFYVTKNPEDFEKQARICLGKDIKIELA